MGVVLIGLGFLLTTSGILRLGTNITPLPYPKDHAPLIETGPYRLVRHPIYSGGVFMALGWACFVHGWLTCAYAIILFLFFDVKSRREEEWLKGKFSNYVDYQKRVRKLIPFVY
jgi:protein-S-isoprenylcysteine O-methyltransferase Ste14